MLKRVCGDGSVGNMFVAYAQGPEFRLPIRIQKTGMAVHAMEAEAGESLKFVA